MEWKSIEIYIDRLVWRTFVIRTQTPKFVKRKLDTTDTHCKVGTIP
jgi:hypothetical protein